MGKGGTLGPWFVRTGETLGQTVSTMQWSVLLLVVLLGMMSNSDVVRLMILLGMLTAVELSGLGLAVLGYDMDRPWRFLFASNKAFLTALRPSRGVSGAGNRGAPAGRHIRSRRGMAAGEGLGALAPKPDASLAAVFLVCAAYTVIVGIVFLLRRGRSNGWAMFPWH
ncbi:hypothetical protein AS189_09605 [Arthrobacter alpinus]|uniref:Uncharacterized protein n=1 Tax=Arthrobacter alpinus TaxID=656366 RepID=A0A0S2LZ14_9MICC|nr:hypothetical protein [Arthrobacter alpinus]ALO66706.1 hypothetical protein AS189_09605 [Arthrobacter alpinus]